MSYLLLFRSLSRAQRAAAALRRNGIYVNLTKAPQSVAPEGCAYGLKLSERRLPAALALLRQEGIEYRRLLEPDPAGGFREAAP